MKTSWSAFGLSLVAFFVPFSFVFDPAILWQGSAIQIATGAAAMLASTALWAIAFAGWCGRALGWPSRIGIGAAGLVAVIAPTGSLSWAVGFIVGWALAVVVFVTAKRGLGAPSMRSS